jgi:hypothetical protein
VAIRDWASELISVRIFVERSSPPESDPCALVHLSLFGLCLSFSSPVAPRTGLDLWLAKVDFEGGLLWETVIGEEGREMPDGVAETSDGGLLRGGSEYLTPLNRHFPRRPSRLPETAGTRDLASLRRNLKLGPTDAELPDQFEEGPS